MTNNYITERSKNIVKCSECPVTFQMSSLNMIAFIKRLYKISRSFVCAVYSLSFWISINPNTHHFFFICWEYECAKCEASDLQYYKILHILNLNRINDIILFVVTIDYDQKSQLLFIWITIFFSFGEEWGGNDVSLARCSKHIILFSVSDKLFLHLTFLTCSPNSAPRPTKTENIRFGRSPRWTSR